VGKVDEHVTKDSHVGGCQLAFEGVDCEISARNAQSPSAKIAVT